MTSTTSPIEWKAVLSGDRSRLQGILDSGQATVEDALAAIEGMTNKQNLDGHDFENTYGFYQKAEFLVDREPALAARALNWTKTAIAEYGVNRYRTFTLLSTILDNPEVARSWEADEAIASTLAQAAAPQDDGAFTHTREVAREGLGKLLKAQPNRHGLIEASLISVIKSITSHNWWIREQGYYALNTILDNAGRIHNDKLIPTIVRAIDAEENDDRKHGNQGSFASRIPRIGRHMLDKILKTRRNMITSDTLVLCAQFGRQGAEIAIEAQRPGARADGAEKPAFPNRRHLVLMA